MDGRGCSYEKICRGTPRHSKMNGCLAIQRGFIYEVRMKPGIVGFLRLRNGSKIGYACVVWRVGRYERGGVVEIDEMRCDSWMVESVERASWTREGLLARYNRMAIGAGSPISRVVSLNGGIFRENRKKTVARIVSHVLFFPFFPF